MQECIQEFEKVLDSKCDLNDGTAVVDMQGVLSNLTFVEQASFPAISKTDGNRML
jgi:hypothetical protein